MRTGQSVDAAALLNCKSHKIIIEKVQVDDLTGAGCDTCPAM
jgi:hypothetical protein